MNVIDVSEKQHSVHDPTYSLIYLYSLPLLVWVG